MRSLNVACVLIYLVLIWKRFCMVKCEDTFDAANNKLENKHLFGNPWLNFKRNDTFGTTGNSNLDERSTEELKDSHRLLMTRRAIDINKLKDYKNKGEENNSETANLDVINPPTVQEEIEPSRYTNPEHTKDKPVQQLRTQICEMFNMNNINISFCNNSKSKLTKAESTELKLNTNVQYLDNINYANFMNKLMFILKNNIDQLKYTINTNTRSKEKSLHEKETGAISQLIKRNTDSIFLNKNDNTDKSHADFENEIQTENNYHKQVPHSNFKDTHDVIRKPYYYQRNHSKRNHFNAFHSSYNQLNDTKLTPNNTTSERNEDNEKKHPNRFEQNAFQYVGEHKRENENNSLATELEYTTNMENIRSNRHKENNVVGKAPSYRKMKNSSDNLRHNRYMITALKDHIYSILLHSNMENKVNTDVLHKITNEIIELLHEPKYKRAICEIIESSRKIEPKANVSIEVELPNKFLPERPNIPQDPIPIEFKDTIAPMSLIQNSSNFKPAKEPSIIKKDSGELKEEIEILPNQFSFVSTTPANEEREETYVKNKIPVKKLVKKQQILQQSETPPKILQKAERNTKQVIIQFSPNQAKINEDITTLIPLLTDDTEVTKNENEILSNITILPESLKLDNESSSFNNGSASDWTTESHLNDISGSYVTTETALVSLLEKNHGNQVEEITKDTLDTNETKMTDNTVDHFEENHTGLINLKIFPGQKLHIVGDGVRIPLKFDKKPDGSFHLAVDIDTLCREKCIHKDNAFNLLHPKMTNRLKLAFSTVSPTDMANETNSLPKNVGLKGIENLDHEKLRQIAEGALNYQLGENNNINSELNKEEISKLLDEYDDVYNFLNSFDENDLQEILVKLKKD